MAWPDYEAPAFCTIKVVCARKSHRCIECGYDIKPGHRYERASGLWDEYFDSHATCLTCVQWRDYAASLDDGSFCYGHLYAVLDYWRVENVLREPYPEVAL